MHKELLVFTDASYDKLADIGVGGLVIVLGSTLRASLHPEEREILIFIAKFLGVYDPVVRP